MAKILLADSNNEITGVIAGMFRRAGHAVEIVNDGMDALGAVDRSRFDLVLTGMNIRSLDAIDLATEVYRTNPALRVMLIAGFAAVAMIPARLRNGRRVPVMTRPVHLRHVVETLPQIARLSA